MTSKRHAITKQQFDVGYQLAKIYCEETHKMYASSAKKRPFDTGEGQAPDAKRCRFDSGEGQAPGTKRCHSTDIEEDNLSSKRRRTEQTDWSSLPDMAVIRIFSHLAEESDRINMALTCKKWEALSHSPELWHEARLDFRNNKFKKGDLHRL